MKHKNSFIKALCIIILIFVVANVYLITVGLVFNRKITTPLYFYSSNDWHIAYNKLEQEYESSTAKSNSEYKELIEQQADFKFYFYKEKEIKGKYCGFAYPTIRLIVIDERLSGYKYALNFAHEVMHLKRFAGDERYICFETFKFLYESEGLHNVGVYYAQRQLGGGWSGEYQIEDLIIKYLLEKER